MLDRLLADCPGLITRPLLPRAMPCPHPAAAIAEALARPIGHKPLSHLAAGAPSAAIVISDGTRKTHSELVVPALLDELAAAGVPESGVTVIVARGLHASCGEETVRRLLGPAWGRVAVVEHDCDGETVDLGRTSRGTPVEINALAARADCLVLTGSVSYHYYAGYGGGRKALLPGIASRRAIQANHRLTIHPQGGVHPAARLGNLTGNPVHEDMVEATALARPAFLVNVVNGPRGKLAACFAGDWRRAHLAAVAFLDEYCRLVEPRPLPLVIADAGGHPYDLTLYQAHKAMESAARLVEDGGALILAAGCEQGLGPAEYREYLGWGLAKLERRLREGEYCVPAQTAHATLRKTGRIGVTLVSGHLPAEDARLAGATLARSLGEALDLAARRLGSLPPAVVMPAAAGLLVEVQQET